MFGVYGLIGFIGMVLVAIALLFLTLYITIRIIRHNHLVATAPMSQSELLRNPIFWTVVVVFGVLGFISSYYGSFISSILMVLTPSIGAVLGAYVGLHHGSAKREPNL